MLELKSIRETFLPDLNSITGLPDVFVRCDLSQVEDRMTKMYCGTERMVELANTKPDEYDAHTENAKVIFEKTIITKQERYLGKKAVHASQRAMRGDKLSESISKDTDGKVFVPAKRCQKMIDAYLDANWEIRDIYMPWVRQVVRDVGVLENSWGRKLDYRRRRICDDLYREAYSFYPQSECADWINQYGFIPGTGYMLQRYGKPLNAHIHDEVMASVPFEEVWDFSLFITMALEQRREIPRGSGNWLVVPASITIGRNWGDQKGVEFNKLPRKEEFYGELEKAGFC